MRAHRICSLDHLIRDMEIHGRRWKSRESPEWVLFVRKCPHVSTAKPRESTRRIDLAATKTWSRKRASATGPSDDGSHPPGPDMSSSEDEESKIATLAPRSQLRPAGSALAFVPYANWDPEWSYDGEPTISWNMEWKIFLKNREQAGKSELDIVKAPRKFWKHVLQPKIAEESVNNPLKRKNTKLILSVTDRKTAKIQKRYAQDVDWSFVATQLREWSRFLKDGKKITIAVTFYDEMTDADTGKSGRGGATANQLAELEARTTGRGQGPSFYQEACRLMQCSGKLCSDGSDHCWAGGNGG